MPKLIVLCPIVGTGNEGDGFRPAVADLLPQPARKQIIPTHPEGHPQHGYPKYLFTLAHVAAADLSAVLAVSNLFAFPDYSLDGRLDGMQAEVRAALIQSVEAYDLDGNGFHLDLNAYGDASSYRDLLLGIVQQLDPGIANLNTFLSLSDIPPSE